MSINRRLLMTNMAWLALAQAAPLRAGSFRQIPQRPSARVIVDNDFAGDPDGVLALAHHLLSPTTQTVLITSSFLAEKMTPEDVAPGRTAQMGADSAMETMRRLDIAGPPPVAAGHEHPMTDTKSPSAAAVAIVAEARRSDRLPLFLCCGGPLTNVAEALRLAPDIAARMTLIWIGGGGYPSGGWEYNLATDAAAARLVIEDSALPLWQVPQPAYRQMQLSIAEMTADVRPISTFTQWLYDQFTRPPSFVTLGGAWPMGDSPPVLLTAITTESSEHLDQPARRILDDMHYGDVVPGRQIRVYQRIDVRTTHADLIAKLRLHAAQAPAQAPGVR
ncbi:nucleoside hydrolase [Blastomonas sp. AAP53]|uniref:nucleoside hydrolase n=1 Tax=Blastomonas sp. AAP53 TaxID=1248760 RepID=UPI0003823812|nr:nucleoside hydrolase [Blastomonas sp. AAP53]